MTRRRASVVSGGGAIPVLACAIAGALGGCIPAGVERREADWPLPPPPVASRTATPPLADRQPRSEPVVRFPAQAPAWEARPVAPQAELVSASTRIVRPGETLRAIAAATGAGAEAIARANALAPPFALRAGQRIVIPGGRYHTVREGQTGIAIARAYGVEWSRIVAANAIAEPYILRTGQRILIPLSNAASPTERAAAFRLDIDDILTGGEPALPPGTRPARAVETTSRALPATAAVAPPARRVGTLAWPVDGRVTTRFGAGDTGERNDGIKIAVAPGTAIRAAADGVVAYAGSDVPGLGGVIIVRHGSSLTTVYGHAQALSVQRGQLVRRGDVIGRSGDTGHARRPQLHFEMRQGRTPIDPLMRLPPR